MPTGKTINPIDVRLKEERCLGLRAAGRSFAEIAVAVGYADRAGAQKAYERALAAEIADHVEDRTRLRAEQADRIRRLLRSLWPAATDSTVSVDVRVKAADAIRRLLEREARLLGLDAPVTVKITDDMDAEIESLLDEFAEAERKAAAAALKRPARKPKAKAT